LRFVALDAVFAKQLLKQAAQGYHPAWLPKAIVGDHMPLLADFKCISGSMTKSLWRHCESTPLNQM